MQRRAITCVCERNTKDHIVSKIFNGKTLGRALLPNEDVHHKDKNPLNNDLDNLEIRFRGEHQAEHAIKYHDKMAVCGWCGKEFLWTGKQQRYFYSNKRNHSRESDMPFCSRTCSGNYGRRVQGDSPRRKLTMEQARYIREHYSPHNKGLNSSALARQFDVDRSVIESIVKGRTYKDVL